MSISRSPSVKRVATSPWTLVRTVLRHGGEIEAEAGELFAVEADLDLGVAHLGRGAQIDQTGDIGERRGHLAGGVVELLDGVGVDLDLDGCPEGEEGGSLEVEVELLGVGQA